jgi:hypothetical protein
MKKRTAATHKPKKSTSKPRGAHLLFLAVGLAILLLVLRMLVFVAGRRHHNF